MLTTRAIPPDPGLLAHLPSVVQEVGERTLSGRYAAEDDPNWLVHLDVDGPGALGVVSVCAPDGTERVHFVAPAESAGTRTYTFRAPDGPRTWAGTVQVGDDGGLTLALDGREPVVLLRSHDTFRQLEVMTVREAGVSFAPATISRAEHDVDFARAVACAGLGVLRSEAEEEVLESDVGADTNRSWDDIELHDAMLLRWFGPREGFRVLTLIAGRHEEGGSLAGVMFDGPSSPDELQRQGLAVFAKAYLHIVSPTGARDAAEASRNRLFTLVHELGHAMNLAHSWEKALEAFEGAQSWMSEVNRPQSSSWMNYPRTEAFWRHFAAMFDAPELLFLRHAPEEAVMMGGSPFFVNHALSIEAELPLDVQVVGPFEFDYLEPPRVTVRIRNRSGSEVRLAGFRDDNRVPVLAEDGLLVGIRGEGEPRWQVLRPYTRALRQCDDLRLAPGEEVYATRYVGGEPGRGSVMTAPGRYELLVEVARSLGRAPVTSVRVADPTAELEDLADDWSAEVVARLYRFEGSHVLTEEPTRGSERPDVEVVRTLARRLGADTRAGGEARLALAGASARPRRVALTKRLQLRPADPEGLDEVAQTYISPARQTADPWRFVTVVDRTVRAFEETRQLERAKRLLGAVQPTRQAALPPEVTNRLAEIEERVYRSGPNQTGPQPN